MPSVSQRHASRPALSIHRDPDDFEPVSARPARRPRIQGSIAVAAGGDPSCEEIAAMSVEALTDAGVTATLTKDGDTAAFDHDVLLLIGSGRFFPQFAELARQRGASRPRRTEHCSVLHAELARQRQATRPRIVLWHQQPLPPPVLTRRAGELGQRLLNGQWEDLLGRWASGLSRLLPASGRVRSMLQRLLALPVRQEFERLGGIEFGNVGWDDLCTIFAEAAWLSETFAEADPWIDVVACSTPTRAAFLRQCGIPARFVPLGFHAGWGELGSEDRDIDVLFVGTCHSPNRRSLVPDVLRQLRDWGYKTCEADVFPCGRQRTELLQRARVVLNVLRFPWEFPGPRLFASAACGALCVSNEAVQNEPFQPGLHFVRAPRTRMAESICSYLSNEEERRRRAARALQSFATDFPLSASLAKLLDPVPHAVAVLSRAA